MGLVGVRPLMVGYMRVLPGMHDQELEDAAGLIRELAAQEGFALGEIFIEHRWQHSSAHVAMVEHCRLNGVRNVAVPSPPHLNTVPALALIAQVAMQQDIDGLVWVAQVTEEEAASVRALLDARPL